MYDYDNTKHMLFGGGDQSGQSSKVLEADPDTVEEDFFDSTLKREKDTFDPNHESEEGTPEKKSEYVV